MTLRRPAAQAFSLFLLFLAMIPHTPVAAASSITYEAYVGADAGNGEAGSGSIIGNGASGSGLNCTTYGNTSLQISSGINSGLTVPSGGIGPCSYYGGAIDNVGATTQAASTGNVSAVFGGTNSFTGSATASSGSASNGDFSLNAVATGSYTGGLGPTTQTQAAAASAASDPNWVVTCPTCSVGEALIPVFTWTFSTSITTNQSYVYQQNPYGGFNLELSMNLNNEGWQPAFQVNFSGGSANPSWQCDYNPVCPSFTVGPGSISGTSVFSISPYDQSVTLGAGKSVTFDEAVGLAVDTADTATVDPNAVLTGIAWETNTIYGEQAVTGVTVTTSNGVYTDEGYSSFSSSPEPVSWILCALGLAAALVKIRRVGAPSN